MSSILGILNIGRLALFAQQKALSVTSQNIANVNTPGYSRQQVTFAPTQPVDERAGQIGTGVDIIAVRRLVNSFVEARITAEASTAGRLAIEKNILGLVEEHFTDTDGSGIHQALIDLFAATHDLANDPKDLPQRVALLGRAESLAQRFRDAANQLAGIRTHLRDQIQESIGQVNAVTREIADLNGAISRAELSGQNANDLRDQRQARLTELSGLIDIHSFEDATGQLTVVTGGGGLLVEGTRTGTLSAAVGQTTVQLLLDPGNGSATDITAALRNGRLKGLTDLYRTELPDYLNQLDRLAAGLITEFNLQHQAGVGLDGSTGLNLFAPLAPVTVADGPNTGTGVVTAAIGNPAALTFDSYAVTFAGGNYTLTNQTTGASTTAAYVDPTPVSFEGLDFNLSGAPAAGDRFVVSAHQGAAATLAVVLTDPKQLAAASAATGLPGDNGNALQLAQLGENTIAAFGTTLEGYYGGLVGAVGTRSQAAQREIEAQTIVSQQLTTQREETSGVSLDEELTRLLQYQRGFEAAARLITVADDLMQTILNIRR